ncbi:MAG: FkbM family methyltransferase [Pseudanabaenaceae cyanobacterium]
MLFTPKLKEEGYLEGLRFHLFQVGSRKMDTPESFEQQRRPVLGSQLSVYGFEANPEGCAAANAQAQQAGRPWRETHFPEAIAGQVGTATLHITQFPACSSLYPPDMIVCARFGLQDLVQVTARLPLTTTTLAAVCRREGVPIDVLYLDIQGAELAALQGAGAYLQDTLCVQTEVEFVPLYHGQPLFGEVDAFLQAQGFALFALGSRNYSRPAAAVYSKVRQGQMVWGEALYLRDPFGLPALNLPLLQNLPRLLKLACIAEILDYPDFTVEILTYLTTRHGLNPRYNFAALLLSCLETLAPNLDVPLTRLLRRHLGS